MLQDNIFKYSEQAFLTKDPRILLLHIKYSDILTKQKNLYQHSKIN